MDVEIQTLTSQVKVADTTGALDPHMVERIVALVLSRIQEAQAARELEKREQEIRPHMAEARF
jgi:hypothetical protein